jgi:putative transposase
MEYRRDEHRVHWIAFHLVWSTKRRRKVLTGDVAKGCRRLIEHKCAERGWGILNLDVKSDSVHLHVMVWPTDSAFEIVKSCKAVTSHELRLKYPDLLKLPSLWTRSYFASTAMSVSAETFMQFMEAQLK